MDHKERLVFRNVQLLAIYLCLYIVVSVHRSQTLNLFLPPLSSLVIRFIFYVRESVLSWNSSTLGTSCKELTHWKRLWCWEGLGAGGEWMTEDEMAGWPSLTRWTRVSVNSGSWWWTGRPGVLRFMGSQRVRHDWATELHWTELCLPNRSANTSPHPLL